MRNYFNFLATAYCASEFSLAEQRCNFVSENAYTESIAKRAKFLASELATFIENHGYQIILYAQNEPGGKNQKFYYLQTSIYIIVGKCISLLGTKKDSS